MCESLFKKEFVIHLDVCSVPLTCKGSFRSVFKVIEITLDKVFLGTNP